MPKKSKQVVKRHRQTVIEFNYIDPALLSPLLDEVYGKQNWELTLDDTPMENYVLKVPFDLTSEQIEEMKEKAKVKHRGQ